MWAIICGLLVVVYSYLSVPGRCPLAEQPTRANGSGPAAKYVYTPFRVTPNWQLPYVYVRCGGAWEVFVIDSGATNTSVSKELATRLGLPLTPRAATLGIDGKWHVTFEAELSSAEIGLTVPKAFTVSVMDFAGITGLAGRDPGVRVRGILGTNFLTAYKAVICYRTNRLYLNDPWAWDRAALQGEWVADDGVLAGEAIDDPVYIASTRLTFTGDRYRMFVGETGDVEEGAFALDAGASPARMTFRDRSQYGARVPGGITGLYDTDGDRLRVLMPSKHLIRPDRLPKRLESTAANGMLRLTYRRAAPGGGDLLGRVWRLASGGWRADLLGPAGCRMLGRTVRPNPDRTLSVIDDRTGIATVLWADGRFETRSAAGAVVFRGKLGRD